MADKKISELATVTTPLAGTEVIPVVQGSITKKVTVNNLTAGKAVSAASLTTTGSVGIGIASPAQKLHVATAGANYIVSHNTSGSTSALLLGAESGKTVIYSWTTPSGATAVPLTFIVGAAETARFDSAGDLTLQTGNLKVATAGKGIDFSANTSAAGMTSELLNDYEEGTWTPVVRGMSTAGTYELQNAYGKYVKVGDLLMIEAYIQLASVITGGGTGNLGITGLPFGKPANAYPTGAAYVANVTITVSPIVVFSSFGASTTLLLQQNASGGFGTSVAIGDVTAGDYISFSMTYRTT